jgi:hypothetical protein
MNKAASVLTLTLLGGGLVFSAHELFAQVAVPAGITQGGIRIEPPTKGETQNLSLTTGSRTALSVGNTTSFGASTNLTLSSGLTGVSRTVLIPSSVSISSKIGDNALQQTKIDISNLSAQGQSGSITPIGSSVSGGTIDLKDGTQYASGNAYIEGMGASVNLGIEPGNATAPGEASFFSTVHPNIKDQGACLPNNTEACAYVVNELVSGNAGASASLSTTTNIDINANSFVNTFAQSF